MADKQPDTQTVIRVKDVHKDFHLPHEKSNSLKSMIVNVFKKKDKEVETQHALRGVSFEIKKGEFFGIVGRNGSGKSTLLKIIAEIYRPTKGSVKVKGKLVPFIELGVGFNPELTGRENVFLNGALLGFSRKEVESKYKQIVEFAELEEFMDQKLKNYSSGMQVRLAFAVAIQAEGDILVLDEVLAVGDEAFQRKCYDYFSDLRRDGKTVVLVTHSMDTVQRFCTRAILIDKSHKMVSGSPMEVAQIYRELNDQEGVTVTQTKGRPNTGTKYLEADVDVTENDEEVAFNVELLPKQDLEDPIIAIEVFKEDGEQVIRWVTDEKVKEEVKLTARKKFNLELRLQNIFPVGKFSVRLLVRRRDRSADYGIFNGIAEFEIKNKTRHEHGILWRPNEKFSIKTYNE